MTEAFDSPTVLTIKYLFGLAGTLGCSVLIIRILFNIELHQFKRAVAPEVEKNLSELTLSTSTSDGSTNSNEDHNTTDHNESSNGNGNINQSIVNSDSIHKIHQSRNEDTYTRKKRMHKETKYAIYFHVALLTFVNYLLLVYLPSGVVPSLIAMTLLTAIILRTQLIEDVRRKRWDRISAVFTALIFMAAFLSLCTYATIGKREGGVYEGKARIVGYDVANYNDGEANNDASGAVRTDLEVEWGGQWGCPDTPEKQCHAYVSGALCEAKSEENRRRRNMSKNRNSNRVLKRKKDEEIEEDEEIKEYYKEVKDEVEEYSKAMEEEVVEDADEEDLEAVEDLEFIEGAEEYDANATEQKIDDLENDLQSEEDTVDGDLENVKTTVLDESDPDGSMANAVINDADADVQELEDKIAELEKEVEVLEEENAEQQEVEQITVEDTVYYAEEAKDEAAETNEVIGEEEELEEDVIYYADVANEEIIDNEALEDANEDLSGEVEELENEVSEVVNYYQDKEANEEVVEEVITTTYYPANATNATGEYYVYTTVEEKVVNKDPYQSSSSSSSFDDDFAYSFEDDAFEDEYWGYDWDSAWGDYACNDLFDTDLESISYNEEEAPGDDEFPYVNIYGTCNSCKAFLVDYYSTEHFDKIKEYQKHAWTYAGFGFLSIFVTGALMVKQHVSPAQDNQIDLLMSDGVGYERTMV